MSNSAKLLFVSPRFLFPVDSGGKIRTTQVLRGMKGGPFEITLASPATPTDTGAYEGELGQICDRFVEWPAPRRGPLFALTRMRHLVGPEPIPVATDRDAAARGVVRKELATPPDVAVFDFPHAAVLAPERLPVPSVMFTHNVEAEIFKRHADVAYNPLKRLVWRDQYRKMVHFEGEALRRFDTIVAVSDRDKEALESVYSVTNVEVIPTGVDLEHFTYARPPTAGGIVFSGSMDWIANIDAMEFFMDDVWPGLIEAAPGTHMTVAGRTPPRHLLGRTRERGLDWEFTGFVDDIRQFIQRASVYVIPLRVGGGTRLKVFEAMALGCPVVSTSIGVEGLPLKAGRHYLRADTPAEFVEATVRLLENGDLRQHLSQEARRYVEANSSHLQAARVFEAICERTMNGART